MTGKGKKGIIEKCHVSLPAACLPPACRQAGQAGQAGSIKCQELKIMLWIKNAAAL